MDQCAVDIKKEEALGAFHCEQQSR
jgi:hypothetical protein